jgi:hypothetical protein
MSTDNTVGEIREYEVRENVVGEGKIITGEMAVFLKM